MADDVVGHHAAGFLAVEGHEAVVPVFEVFEDGGDDGGIKFFGLDGGEVFVGGEINKEFFL